MSRNSYMGMDFVVKEPSNKEEIMHLEDNVREIQRSVGRVSLKGSS